MRCWPRRRWVVVTASAAPAELPGLLPALAEPAGGRADDPLGPARPGSPTGRSASSWPTLRNVQLPEPVAQVLAEGLPARCPELAGALMQLAMRHGLNRRRTDRRSERVRQYLARREAASGSRALHEIALATARHFSLRLSDLRSPVRRRALVTARGVAVYLARHSPARAFRRSAATSAAATIPPSCTVAVKWRKLLRDRRQRCNEAIEQLRKELWKT